MQEKLLYEYAVIRVMPDVERGELLNIGLLMMCKRRRWIKAAVELDPARLLALWPSADVDAILCQTASFTGGPMDCLRPARLPPYSPRNASAG